MVQYSYIVPGNSDLYFKNHAVSEDYNQYFLKKTKELANREIIQKNDKYLADPGMFSFIIQTTSIMKVPIMFRKIVNCETFCFNTITIYDSVNRNAINKVVPLDKDFSSKFAYQEEVYTQNLSNGTFQLNFNAQMDLSNLNTNRHLKKLLEAFLLKTIKKSHEDYFLIYSKWVKKQTSNNLAEK